MPSKKPRKPPKERRKKLGRPLTAENEETQARLRKLMSPIEMALQARSITVEALARQIDDELHATETKAFKSRGEPVCYSKPMRAWNVQQRAREDVQKLLGLYPAEEHRISAEIEEKMPDDEREVLKKIAAKFADELRRGK